MVKKKIKKIDLIKHLNSKIGYSNSFSKKLIDDLIKIINVNIKTGNLSLKNIGTFKILKKKERIGRNPKTGKTHLISSRKTISFTPSKRIIRKLNEII